MDKIDELAKRLEGELKLFVKKKKDLYWYRDFKDIAIELLYDVAQNRKVLFATDKKKIYCIYKKDNRYYYVVSYDISIIETLFCSDFQSLKVEYQFSEES